MRKIHFYIFTSFLTFAVGVSVAMITGRTTENSLSTFLGFSNGKSSEARSCQVKQVEWDGRAVWMSCSEWLKSQKN